MDQHGNYGRGAKRGPYGTNIGDTWMAPDSDVQRRCDEEGKGERLCFFINDNGEEAVYVTSDPEMIAEAERGHELYVAALAARN
jgi:hypothetical protein